MPRYLYLERIKMPFHSEVREMGMLKLVVEIKLLLERLELDPEALVKSAIFWRAVGTIDQFSNPNVRSSQKAWTSISESESRWQRRGSRTRRKRIGDSGHPCLRPFVM
jgi:hypothetical protein